VRRTTQHEMSHTESMASLVRQVAVPLSSLLMRRSRLSGPCLSQWRNLSASTTALAVVETETTGQASQVKEAVVAMAEQASPELWDSVRRVLERGPA